MKWNVRISKHHIIGIVICVLVALVFVGFLIMIYNMENTESEPANSSTTSSTAPTRPDMDTHEAVMYVDGVAYKENPDVEAVLFLGLDKYLDEAEGTYINNQQADTQLLVIFDHASKEVSLLPINRDTMTQVDTYAVNGDYSGTQTMQIALAHAYGLGYESSCKNASKAVSNLLYGIEVDHYASLKMDAVSYLNDAVGGVPLTLSEDFTSLDPSFVKGAAVVLNGEQAMAYVRSRAGTEEQTNTSRMSRQNQYIEAWTDAFLTEYAQNDALVGSVFLEIEPYTYTDLSVNEMDDLAHCLQTYTQNPVLTIAGESKQGEQYMEFHVDEDALQKQVLDLFYIPVES